MMATAPIGYANKILENGKKLISPKEPQAGIIKWVFEELSASKFNTEQILKHARLKGLVCSKNNFWTLIRNPVYCGKIFIPKFKDEESKIVHGQHEAIISETLFYDVQDVLDGRKKNQLAKIYADDNMPLRGFLICPKCGKALTGSASKGSKKRYHYYHCTSSCGWRYNAHRMNEKFLDELRKYVPHPFLINMYTTVINQEYKSQTKDQHQEYKILVERLTEAEKEFATARKLLLKEQIETSDYRTIKADCEKKINILEAKLISYSHKAEKIEPLLEKAANSLSCLDKLYKEGSVVKKRQIISSIFPEKLTFDGFNYRTTRLNEAIQLIYSLDKSFSENKNETNHNFCEMSHMVIPLGEFFFILNVLG